MNVFGFLKRKHHERSDSPDQRYFRITVWAFVGMFVLFGLYIS